MHARPQDFHTITAKLFRSAARRTETLEENYKVLPAEEDSFRIDICLESRYNEAMNVYLDHAAATPLLPEVFEEMKPLLCREFGNPDSLHAYGRRAAAYITDARDRVARTLGVAPGEVYFTSGGTEADNWAVRCLGAGDLVLSPIEHAAVLSSAPLRGGNVFICPVGEDGVVTKAHLGRTMPEHAGMVAVMSVNNETGVVQPVEELARAAHACGALFFSDCVQAACRRDLKQITRVCDAISLSSHKLGGPKGAGALIVKKGVPLKPLIAGGEQERGLRGGTVNVAAGVGFACALELAQQRREAFCRHTGALRDLFEEIVLSALGGAVRVDGEDRAPNISHLTFEGGGAALLSLLDLKGVACSAGAACSAHASLPSHVLRAMGRTEEQAAMGLRFSFGPNTTEQETVYAANVVVDCLRR